MSALDCPTVEPQLVALVQGELPPQERREIRAHLQGCPECRDQKAEVEALFDCLAIVPEPEVSPDFDAGLRDRLARVRTRYGPVRELESGGLADASPRGLAFVVQFVRHRVETAPILVASVAIHLVLLGFLAVWLLSTRAGGPSSDQIQDVELPTPPPIDERALERLRQSLPPPNPTLIHEPGQPTPPDEAPPNPSPPGGVPPAYAGRFSPRRILEAMDAGESLPAIEAGLTRLAGLQQRGGGWPVADDATTAAQIRASSLALLALLAHGQTARQGTHRAAVARGLAWLRTQQQPASGLFGSPDGPYLEGHALATRVLAEHALLEPGAAPGDRTRARRGLALLLGAQRVSGGWGPRSGAYGEAHSDLTATVVETLGVASQLGLTIPDATRAGARRWFAGVTDDRGRVGDRRKGDGLRERFPATCLGLRVARLRGDAPDPRQLRHALATARASLARADAGQPPRYGLWQQTAQALVGLPEGRTWYDAVAASLRRRRRADGAWPSANRQQTETESTALAVLTLQTPYR